MSPTGDRTLVEDLLANGVDDWIYAGWVHQIAKRTGLQNPADLRTVSLGIIAEVLARGLMVPGEYNGEGHRPWECSTASAMERITESWVAWGDTPPTPGAIVWLALTQAGREIGEAVLEREQR